MKHSTRFTIMMALLSAATLTTNAETTRTKTVDSGGSGAYKAVVAAESTLPDYTIYRPKNLAAAVAKEGPLPLLVWGNGACSNTNLGNERMLNEIASRGYVVVAVGPFRLNDNDGFVDNGSDGKNMTRAVDWIMQQDKLPDSEYYGMIDTKKIAASGHSCGGAEAMYTSTDSRVKSIIMMNSGMGGMGMAGASPSNLQSIHGPILYVVGGPDDVAYGNALQDYDNIKVNQPVCFMTKNIGHGGTFWDQYGGDYGKIMPDWLDWVFKGKKANIKIFRDGVMTKYSGWELKSKNMPTYLDESAPLAMTALNYMHGNFTLPTTSDPNESVTWELEEQIPGYVQLSKRTLTLSKHPEGNKPLTVGRLTGHITYNDKTTTISNVITLAPVDTTYGVLFSYVNPDDNTPALAYAYHTTKKLTYNLLPSDASIFDVEYMAPLNKDLSEVHIYRDLVDNDCFLMTCNDATPESEKSHTFTLLKSRDLKQWDKTCIDLWEGKAGFLDATKSAAYSATNYPKIIKASAPRITLISPADRDTLPYFATSVLRSTVATEKNARIFYSFVDSTFTTMTQPRVLFDPKENVLDAVVEFSPYDSLYHILYITKTGDNAAVLYHTSSKTLLKNATWNGNKRAITTVKNPMAITLYRAQNKALYNIYAFAENGNFTQWQTDTHFTTLTKISTYTKPKALPGEAVFISEAEYDALIDWTTAIDALPAEATRPSTRRYSLFGLPVGPGYKGIVIDNGKKVIVRH